MQGPGEPSRWRLSLILPAFNEEKVIHQAIVEADTALRALCADYEILVVDDGSHDDTAAAVLSEAATRPHVRLLRHPENRGYGATLRTGFSAAGFPLVAFTDADCQFYVEDLGLLLPLTDSVPIAAGYRLERKDKWHRRFLAGGFNVVVRSLLGIRVRDCDCALKVFRREVLAQVMPETSGFFASAEILVKARQAGLEVAEAGVRHRPRLQGTSKVSLTQIPRVLRTLLFFWWTRVLFGGRRSSP